MTRGITSIRIKPTNPFPINPYHKVVSLTKETLDGSFTNPDTACITNPIISPATVANNTRVEKLIFFLAIFFNIRDMPIKTNKNIIVSILLIEIN